MIRIVDLNTINGDELFKRNPDDSGVSDIVKGIIREVRTDGDEALKRFAARFDGCIPLRYALPGGESLNTVIMRSQNALKRLLDDPADITVAGTHGTALCALLHALDDGFGYADFQRIVGIMPWIVRCTFDGDRLIAREETIFE